jgi:hypothetical protein
MSSEDSAMRNPTADAIKIAARLLEFAAEDAIAIPKDVTHPIVAAIDAVKHGSLSAFLEGDFWAAYTELCRRLPNISIANLSPEYISAVKRQQRDYVRWCLILLVILLPLSACGFLVKALTNDIENIAQATCDMVLDLKCAKPPLSAQPKPIEAGSPDLTSSWQDLNYASYKIELDNEWMNWLILHQYSSLDLDGAYKCDGKQTLEGNLPNCNELAKNKRRVDYPHSFEGHIYLARALKAQSDLLYGALGAFLLPTLYAMLGACVFGFRSLIQGERSSIPSRVRVSVRLVLAAVAGFIIGSFADFSKGVSISPLALAFIPRFHRNPEKSESCCLTGGNRFE